MFCPNVVVVVVASSPVSVYCNSILGILHVSMLTMLLFHVSSNRVHLTMLYLIFNRLCPSDKGILSSSGFCVKILAVC